MEDISARIRAFIREKFPLARKQELHDAANLLESGILDSLGILDVVAFVEGEFAISISDDELVPENFQSIRHLTAFVQSKNGKTPSLR